MKAYVLGYRTKTDEEIEAQRRTAVPFARIEEIEVQYHSRPVWRIPSHEAEWRCAELQRSRIHVGQHYCEFSLEELPEGNFAIVCESHPSELRTAQ